MLRILLVFQAFILLPSLAFADFPEVFNTEPIGEESLMPAAQAASAMTLPPGFVATAFASEPDIQNPIAMAWDGKGRLWVAENYTYAEREQRFQLDLRDRVVIFDNTTGDRFANRVVFTDNVQMLTGIEVGHDGVWLMCPPKLIFVPDRDHDDVPDSEGEIVLDGFEVAEQNYHNFANGLRFGPDGWLYGRCGGSCPGRIGLPGSPEHERHAMEGGMWRYHPTHRLVEVLTTGTTNPWGHDWNSVGEAFFVNTVNGHLWHLIPGAHFTRPFTLDPNRRTYELIDFHADHWHFDTGQNWMDSRDGAANAYGGGHAHSGAMIYQADNWPQSYRDKLFTLNFHGRRANQEKLVRDGSGYVAKHGDDFFIAADSWFRGMELSSGPDGAVFVLDWSDAGECHEHTGVHRTSGRIFKIRYQGATAESIPLSDMKSWSLGELAEAHRSSNDWFVRQARLELARRHLRSLDVILAANLLEEMFEASSSDSSGLVRSLVTLHSIGAVSDSRLQSLLTHPHEHVRAWSIRILTETWTIDDALGPVFSAESRRDNIRRESESLLPELVRLASTDDSSLVRLTLASTLQRLPVEHRAILASALVGHAGDAEDHNLPLMIWYGLMAVADERPAELVGVAGECRLPLPLMLISRCLAEQIEDEPLPVQQLLDLAVIREELRVTILTGISQGLKGWRRAPKPENWDNVVAASDPRTASLVTELSVVFGDGRAMDDLRRILDGTTPSTPETRMAALNALIASRPDDLRSVCESLLGDNHLNVLAARGLSSFDDPQIARSIVGRYWGFRGPYQPQIISILASRREFAAVLVDAIREGQIPRDDLSAYQVRQIRGLGDESLNQQLSEVWGEVRDSPEEKLQQIKSIEQMLASAASSDKKQGRALFVKHCQTCHRLYGEGAKVGPDLTGGNRGNLDYLLSNIVDPSAVVDKDFRMSVLLTDDGRVLNGLVTEESDRTLTMQTATENLTLDKEEIQSRRKTEKSPMPDGLLDTLTAEQVRDLIGYLRHPSQVPLPE